MAQICLAWDPEEHPHRIVDRMIIYICLLLHVRLKDWTVAGDVLLQLGTVKLDRLAADCR